MKVCATTIEEHPIDTLVDKKTRRNDQGVAVCGPEAALQFVHGMNGVMKQVRFSLSGQELVERTEHTAYQVYINNVRERLGLGDKQIKNMSPDEVRKYDELRNLPVFSTLLRRDPPPQVKELRDALTKPHAREYMEICLQTMEIRTHALVQKVATHIGVERQFKGIAPGCEKDPYRSISEAIARAVNKLEITINEQPFLYPQPGQRIKKGL